MHKNNLFYQPLSIKAADDEIWFWSDLHLGHDPKWDIPLWKMRGFSSVLEHDSELIIRWNKNIKGTVFHLGDICFGKNGEARLLHILSLLNFERLYLLPGNHQAGWKQLFELASWTNGYPELEIDGKFVYFVPNYLETFVNNHPVVMSHYAILSWNGQGKGSYHLHGHSHGSLYSSEMGLGYYKAKSIDLGVENCPNPMSFADIKEKFNEYNIVSFDHHNKETQNPF